MLAYLYECILRCGVKYYCIMVESQEIELQGHIIDSGIMTQLFDRVMDMGGNFEILVFDMGKKKTDPSYARLQIVAQDKEKLRSILSELHRLGARSPRVKSCPLCAGDRGPERPKRVLHDHQPPDPGKAADEWIPVDDIEMDFLIVVDPKKKACPVHASWEDQERRSGCCRRAGGARELS